MHLEPVLLVEDASSMFVNDYPTSLMALRGSVYSKVDFMLRMMVTFFSCSRFNMRNILATLRIGAQSDLEAGLGFLDSHTGCERN